MRKRITTRERRVPPGKRPGPSRRTRAQAEAIAVTPRARIIEPLAYFMPSCWRWIQGEDRCDYFEFEGLNDVAVEYAFIDHITGEDPPLNPSELLAERNDGEFEMGGPVVHLKTGFSLVSYSSRKAEADGSGRRHYCELCSAGKLGSLVVVRYQTILPEGWRSNEKRIEQIDTLWRYAALTRLITPLEAAWFRHPGDAPADFFEAAFSQKLGEETREPPNG